MSYCQLAQMQNARNAFIVGRNLAERNSGQGYWFDWTLDRILLNEAAELIEKQVPSSSAPLSFKEREALVRRRAEARELITKAVSLVNKNQMAEADQLVGTLSVSGGKATVGLAVFRALGDWAAVQGNWRRAAEYYSALVPLNRFEMPSLATQDYNKYAVVLSEMEDRRAYESVCRDYIKQFGDTANPRLIERMVKTCSLLPPSAALLAALSPLANTMRKSIPTDADRNDGALPWQCMSLAVFEYRRGNYAEAVNWGNRCLSFTQGAATECVAVTQAILAMSYHQLGQAEQSRSALRKSRELVGERWKTPLTVNADSRGWWYDWVFARILEVEAGTTIEPPAPATNK
jgi:tetratricopeptide (TPR) repeat protein